MKTKGIDGYPHREPQLRMLGQPDQMSDKFVSICAGKTRLPIGGAQSVALPDLSGLDLQQRVSDRIDLPIIFIGDRSDVSTTVKGMKAGAVEFLTKPLRSDVMRSAMRDAIDRSRVALRHEAGISVLWERYAALSRREREVTELVLSGWLNKQIAAKLGIT